MLSPDRPVTSKDIPAIAAEVLERIRTRTPRVHCITNVVAQNFSANMLLAVGAIPSMTIAPDEIVEFAARAEIFAARVDDVRAALTTVRI